MKSFCISLVTVMSPMPTYSTPYRKHKSILVSMSVPSPKPYSLHAHIPIDPNPPEP